MDWDFPPINPNELTNAQKDALLLVLLKHIRPKLKPSDLNEVRFPDGSAKLKLDKLLSQQFAEQELKKKRMDEQ
jgi:hypothetical protein